MHHPLPAPDGATASAADIALPAWDLTDLYPAPDSPALEADFARAAGRARALSAAHAGHIAARTGAELAAVLAEYEQIEETW